MADVTRKPNIVFVLCDNVGWGDFGVYGGGTPTPRIDQLADEGIRLNNYCVEAQCTPTRSAIMTGRQSVRSVTFRVPFAGEGKAGLAPWEYTIAELLSDAGYATSLFGKWHCGDTEGRLPPIRASTSGGATATASTRPAGRPTRRSTRSPRPKGSSRPKSGRGRRVAPRPPCVS
ncbi:MAG: sulfatase-like hydrolase/transferase [Mycetocola sp.]